MVHINEMASWGRISEQGWRKGPWTPEEDKLLMEYVSQHGEGRWSCVSKCAGLNRSGKSCRLRWVNYLRPGLKKGHITPQEEGIIIELHALWGNKWSTIARYLPGRTDNEIKNYWRTHFKKKSKPSNDQNNVNTEDKTKILLRQLQEEQNEKKFVEDDMEKGTQATEAAYNANVVNVENDHHQFLQPVMYQDHHGAAGLMSENYNFIPLDNYLWSGLWNMDDHHQNGNNCGKMAIQNQANVANCSARGGDNAINYMQSGGYIF